MMECMMNTSKTNEGRLLLMEIEVGKVYNVEIEDCCIQGEFTSKLITIKITDDNNVTSNLDKADLYHGGQELHFENGVILYNEGGMTCEAVS